MKNSKELLSSVVKTAQMGQTGIRSVLDTSMRPSLRKALESQLREYDSIETEAHTIASQRGWELKELDPGVRMMTDMMTRMKLHGRNTDSKIADMASTPFTVRIRLCRGSGICESGAGKPAPLDP